MAITVEENDFLMHATMLHFEIDKARFLQRCGRFVSPVLEGLFDRHFQTPGFRQKIEYLVELAVHTRVTKSHVVINWLNLMFKEVPDREKEDTLAIMDRLTV